MLPSTYENFIHLILESETGETIGTGDSLQIMKVALVNNGPGTILIDSKDRK